MQKVNLISKNELGGTRSLLPSPCAWILGALLSLGSFAAVEGSVSFLDARLYLRFLLFAVASQVAFFAGEKALAFVSDSSDSGPRVGRERWWVNRFEYGNGLESVLRDGVRVYICWLPYVLLLFPGVIYWDTGDQLAQFFGFPAFGMDSGVIWDHHPFFDAFLYGSFLKMGHALCGSYDAGTFAFSIFQSFLAAASFAWLLSHLRDRGVGADCLRIIRDFIRFFPVFPVAFVILVKDVTHVVFFLQWCILFDEIVCSRGKALRSIRFICLLFVVSLLCALTKKTATYIVVLCLIGLWLCLDTFIGKVIATGVAAGIYLVIQVLLPTHLYPALNIVEGGPQAAIVVPIEQVARVAHYYPDDVTEEEKTAIDSYLLTGWDVMSQSYNPYIADPVTAYNVRDKAGTKRFMKAWLTIGLRHPMTYLNAFLVMESGWISFSSTSAVDTPTEPYSSVPLQLLFRFSSNTNPDTFGKVRPDTEPSSGSLFVESVYDFFKDTPVINVLFSIALWTACLPFFSLYVLVHNHRRRGKGARGMLAALVRFSPYYVSVATLFLYAVSLSLPTQDNPSRYMLHAVVLAPLYLGLLCSRQSGARA